MKKEANIYIKIDPGHDTLDEIRNNLSSAFLNALNNVSNGNPEDQKYRQRIGEISSFIMGDKSAEVELDGNDTIQSAIEK